MAPSNESVYLESGAEQEYFLSLTSCFQYKSWKNIIPLLTTIQQFTYSHVLVLTAPPGTGKSTMMKNAALFLSKKGFAACVDSIRLWNILHGTETVSVELSNGTHFTDISYERSPEEERKRKFITDNCGKSYVAYVEIGKKITTGAMLRDRFVEPFEKLYSDLCEEYPILNNQSFESFWNEDPAKAIQKMMREIRKHSNKKPQVYVFIDDYDLPLCELSCLLSDRNEMLSFMTTFALNSKAVARVIFIGCLPFVAYLLNAENVIHIHTSESRLFGLPVDMAKQYLESRDITDSYKKAKLIRKASGIGNAVCYEVHPICFFNSFDTSKSQIEDIVLKMKNYDVLLELMAKSTEVHEVVVDILAKGFYNFNDVPFMTTTVLADQLRTHRLSRAACVRVLEYIGFLCVYTKEQVESSCLKEIKKDVSNLPPKFYSFTNELFYRCFLEYGKKLTPEKFPRLDAIPFKRCQNSVGHIYFAIKEVFSTYNRNVLEPTFTKSVFAYFIQLFPTYLVTHQFALSNGKKLDVAKYSYDLDDIIYVYEFKIIPDCDEETLGLWRAKALHQIYCRKYYTFEEYYEHAASSKNLERMRLVVVLSDKSSIIYVAVFKFNENYKCDCEDYKMLCTKAKKYDKPSRDMTFRGIFQPLTDPVRVMAEY